MGFQLPSPQLVMTGFMNHQQEFLQCFQSLPGKNKPPVHPSVHGSHHQCAVGVAMLVRQDMALSIRCGEKVRLQRWARTLFVIRVGCHKILTSVGLKLVLGEKVRGEGTIDPGWGFLFGQRVYSPETRARGCLDKKRGRVFPLFY